MKATVSFKELLIVPRDTVHTRFSMAFWCL